MYDPIATRQDSAGEHSPGPGRWSLGAKTEARYRCLREFVALFFFPQGEGSGGQEGQGESGAPWIAPTAGPGPGRGGNGSMALQGLFFPPGTLTQKLQTH